MSIENYQKLEKVGEGSCGVVFKCRDRKSGRIVAVKKVRFSYDNSDVFGVPAAALREVALLNQLNGHPNIVRIENVFLDTGARIFIVCEFMDLDLRRFMDEQGQLHPRRVKLYAWQMLRALGHCHGLCIAHRDIKPQNVLVNPVSDCVKLCDFSLGRRLVVTSEVQTSLVASLWYRSPEILLGGDAVGMPLDVWSMGCVFGEMLQHSPIFPGSSEIETLLLHFRLLGTPTEKTWPGVSELKHWSERFPHFHAPATGLRCITGDPCAAQVMSGLLLGCPIRRLSAGAAIKHDYFLDLDHTAHSGAVQHAVAEEASADEAVSTSDSGGQSLQQLEDGRTATAYVAGSGPLGHTPRSGSGSANSSPAEGGPPQLKPARSGFWPTRHPLVARGQQQLKRTKPHQQQLRQHEQNLTQQGQQGELAKRRR